MHKRAMALRFFFVFFAFVLQVIGIETYFFSCIYHVRRRFSTVSRLELRFFFGLKCFYIRKDYQVIGKKRKCVCVCVFYVQPGNLSRRQKEEWADTDPCGTPERTGNRCRSFRLSWIHRSTLSFNNILYNFKSTLGCDTW